MNKVKLKFLILYSVVCTMALIRTCTNDDMFVGFALREISGLELPTGNEGAKNIRCRGIKAFPKEINEKTGTRGTRRPRII